MNTEEKGEMGNCQLVRDVDKALLELCTMQGLEPVRLDAEGRALMARVVAGKAMGDIGSMNSQLITSGQEVYFSCVTIHEQGLCIEIDREHRFIPWELATKQEEAGKSRHDDHVSEHLETLGLAGNRADSGWSKARGIRELEEAANILQEACELAPLGDEAEKLYEALFKLYFAAIDAARKQRESSQPDEPACSA